MHSTKVISQVAAAATMREMPIVTSMLFAGMFESRGIGLGVCIGIGISLRTLVIDHPDEQRRKESPYVEAKNHTLIASITWKPESRRRNASIEKQTKKRSSRSAGPSSQWKNIPAHVLYHSLKHPATPLAGVIPSKNNKELFSCSSLFGHISGICQVGKGVNPSHYGLVQWDWLILPSPRRCGFSPHHRVFLLKFGWAWLISRYTES
ncbi:hypothetical protein BDW42DRAFT_134693 [Aspergillus taichungensis]|uniref:Uncharacterized protein n=1 Tax=Aspergillus taichungensis TaxID=482145 RepID=A0A2J5HPA7_9EURO|nr:hypothetical protein BDW42DRAFT_134693 [Aspergillus taichungensis]